MLSFILYPDTKPEPVFYEAFKITNDKLGKNGYNRLCFYIQICRKVIHQALLDRGFWVN